MPDRSTGTYRRLAIPPDQDDVRNVGVGLLPQPGLADSPAPRDTATYDAVLTLTVSTDGAVLGVLPGRGAPPLGIDLMAACRTGGIPMSASFRYLLPFIGVMIAVLFLLVLFPQLVMVSSAV